MHAHGEAISPPGVSRSMAPIAAPKSCTAGRLVLSSTRSLKPKHVRVFGARAGARLAQAHAARQPRMVAGMNRSHNRPNAALDGVR
jgi:hypothetical protein